MKMPIDKDTWDKASRLKEVVLAFLCEPARKEEGKGYSSPEIALEIHQDFQEVGHALSELFREKKVQRLTYAGKYYYRCV